MVLLHLRITDANQILTLHHDIKAQYIILRKVVIKKDISGSSHTTGGGLCLDLNSMTNSYEIMTSEHNSMLTLPIDDAKALSNLDFHVKFSAENIKNQFAIPVFKYDGLTKPSFDSGTSGHIDSIDIYFEYSSNDHTY